MSVVTFLGPAGTFTQQALEAFVEQGVCGDPDSVESQAVDSPAAALQAVREGKAEYACVAIESSVDGPVTPTFDALAAPGALQIYRETDVPIAFSILVRPGTQGADAADAVNVADAADVEAGTESGTESGTDTGTGADTGAGTGAPPASDAQQIKTFAAHPVAQAQIRHWLGDNLPHVEFIAASSNAAAAAMVARGEVDAAAAPPRAGEIYKLATYASAVADIPDARTRFVLVGRPGVPTPRSGTDRTSVVFNLNNGPGALVAALTAISSHGVDMTRIESRPTGQHLGDYRFYVDMSGHIDDAHTWAALQDLKLVTAALRYLGSWPTHKHAGPTGPPQAWHEATNWVQDRAAGITPNPEGLW